MRYVADTGLQGLPPVLTSDMTGKFDQPGIAATCPNLSLIDSIRTLTQHDDAGAGYGGIRLQQASTQPIKHTHIGLEATPDG